MTQIIDRFIDISANYDVAFVDLWGCIHDGIKAFPVAVKAMQDFRAKGGVVVLLTNSPRPRQRGRSDCRHGCAKGCL